MADTLDGTVALVTGASSGIGAAAARALVRQGAAVTLAARRKDRLEQLAQDLTGDGGRVLLVATDVTDRTRAEAAVQQTVDAFGRLDTLVNNAGQMLLGPAEDAPIDEWDRMVAVNVQGVLYMARAALPHLLAAARQGPRHVADMVNISSVAGRRPAAGSAVYNLTKHGVGAFSEALRQEVTERHVRISLVEPGAVDTELSDHIREGIREQALEPFAGVERLHADDIADAITYIVTRGRHIAVNELLIRPTEQQR